MDERQGERSIEAMFAAMTDRGLNDAMMEFIRTFGGRFATTMRMLQVLFHAPTDDVEMALADGIIAKTGSKRPPTREQMMAAAAWFTVQDISKADIAAFPVLSMVAYLASEYTDPDSTDTPEVERAAIFRSEIQANDAVHDTIRRMLAIAYQVGANDAELVTHGSIPSYADGRDYALKVMKAFPKKQVTTDAAP